MAVFTALWAMTGWVLFSDNSYEQPSRQLGSGEMAKLMFPVRSESLAFFTIESNSALIAQILKKAVQISYRITNNSWPFFWGYRDFCCPFDVFCSIPWTVPPTNHQNFTCGCLPVWGPQQGPQDRQQDRSVTLTIPSLLWKMMSIWERASIWPARALIWMPLGASMLRLLVGDSNLKGERKPRKDTPNRNSSLIWG